MYIQFLFRLEYIMAEYIRKLNRAVTHSNNTFMHVTALLKYRDFLC